MDTPLTTKLVGRLEDRLLRIQGVATAKLKSWFGRVQAKNQGRVLRGRMQARDSGFIDVTRGRSMDTLLTKKCVGRPGDRLLRIQGVATAILNLSLGRVQARYQGYAWPGRTHARGFRYHRVNVLFVYGYSFDQKCAGRLENRLLHIQRFATAMLKYSLGRGQANLDIRDTLGVGMRSLGILVSSIVRV